VIRAVVFVQIIICVVLKQPTVMRANIVLGRVVRVRPIKLRRMALFVALDSKRAINQKCVTVYRKYALPINIIPLVMCVVRRRLIVIKSRRVRDRHQTVPLTNCFQMEEFVDLPAVCVMLPKRVLALQSIVHSTSTLVDSLCVVQLRAHVMFLKRVLVRRRHVHLIKNALQITCVARQHRRAMLRNVATVRRTRVPTTLPCHRARCVVQPRVHAT